MGLCLTDKLILIQKTTYLNCSISKSITIDVEMTELCMPTNDIFSVDAIFKNELGLIEQDLETP